MEVTVYGPLRGVTGEKTVELDADPDSVAGALDAFVTAYPRAERQLFDDDGDVRPSVRVAIDGETAAPDDPRPPGAAVSIYPAVQGG